MYYLRLHFERGEQSTYCNVYTQSAHFIVEAMQAMGWTWTLTELVPPSE